MEEPQEVHTNENKALSEKKPKRIVKTPAQVAALENFYNEHKYPTETMKAELAEAIGLTEKQVSGWFCHRRLKDKKLPTDEVGPHGKQDRSSGVIQDRGSGLRQDSCGSTKQGDNKHNDLKEVESRRFNTESHLPIEVPFDHGSQHNSIMGMDDDDDDVDDDDDDDDTSSGSRSPLNDNFHPQNVDHLGTLTTRYPTHNDFKSVKGRTGPSGYLKVKGQIENAAITAVKRQLGRNYKEDGPPLGIEFEPLPPGAFENPVKIPVNQSYYVGDRTILHPLDGSKTFQPPNGSKMHERYNPKSYDPMDLDESAGLEIRHASKHHEKSQYKSALPISKHSRHALSERSLQMVVVNDNDSAGETSVQDNQFETRIKHGPGIIRRPDSLSNHHVIGYGKNFDGKQAENYTRSGPPKVNYRDRVEPLTSDFTYKRGEVLQLEERGLSRKAPKVDEFDRERRGIDEYSRLVSLKIHPGNEMRKVAKRSRDEFMHQVYPIPRKEVDFPHITNKTIRSTAQMISSFSDDETAETTSSGD